MTKLTSALILLSSLAMAGVSPSMSALGFDSKVPSLASELQKHGLDSPLVELRWDAGLPGDECDDLRQAVADACAKDEQAQAAKQAADAELRKGKAELAGAENEVFQRNQDVLVAQADLDNCTSPENCAQAQINLTAAQARLDDAISRLELAQVKLLDLQAVATSAAKAAEEAAAAKAAAIAACQAECTDCDCP